MIAAPAEERLAIQELSASYAFSCDTKRYDRVAELFTDDATWDETAVGLPLCRGREAIHGLFTSMADADLEFLIHISSNHRLTQYDVDTAAGTWHLHVEGRYNGQPIRILGYYDDAYARVGGEWRFTTRRLIEIAPSSGFAL